MPSPSQNRTTSWAAREPSADHRPQLDGPNVGTLGHHLAEQLDAVAIPGYDSCCVERKLECDDQLVSLIYAVCEGGGSMPRKTEKASPADVIALERMGERQWTFRYARIGEPEWERFYEAQEIWYSGDPVAAEALFRRLVSEYPEFVDAYHHLAMLVEGDGRRDDAFRIWESTVDLALSCFPSDFYFGRDKLAWHFLENRPFLRAYHGLGLSYLRRDQLGEALLIFNNLLDVNPDDNQGVRALAIDVCFRVRRPFDALSICARYPDDTIDAVLYGRVLAWYQLGHMDQATEALEKAHKWLPLIAQELVKTRHTPPRNLRPDRVTVGGPDEAYVYWQDQGEFWKSTPGAIAFVRAHIAKKKA
jgi:tetratricopeptide (TPR) repeat protein